jgi:tetratricopeptide (TPR) repeat protein
MTFPERTSLSKNPLIIYAFLVVCILGFPQDSTASSLTYQRDYAYQASEADSKLSCRTIALEQVKRLLLEELGTYLESHTEVRNYQVSRDQVIAITAGIVRAEILQEKWDGMTYFIIAKITVDPKQVARAVDDLRRERQSLSELEESKRRADDLLGEIEKLQAELKSSKQGQSQQEEKNYAAAVKKLGAVDWYKEGYALMESRKYGEAVGFFDKAIDADPHYATAYSVRAFAHHRMKNYQQSLKDVNRALELKPDHAGALTNRALTLGSMKEYDKALVDVNRAISLKPDFARAYNIRAFVYLNLRNNRQAIENSNRAIELNPYFAAPYCNRGLAQSNMKRFEDAFKDFQRAIEIDPEDARPYHHRGWTYLRLKKYDEAIRDFNKSLEREPDFVPALYRRGLSYYGIKDYHMAARDFSKVVESEKDHADAYYQPSLCYMNMGKKEESARDLKQAAQLGHSGAQRAIKYKKTLPDENDEQLPK